MLSTDTDGLHGTFLTLDENGQRIFALTTSGVTVLQLSNVPLELERRACGGPSAEEQTYHPCSGFQPVPRPR